MSVGYSSRIGPDDILPVLDRLNAPRRDVYRNGSAALSLCYVACGRLLGYIEPHINSWDCLGALAVIESAGGRSNYRLTDDTLLGSRIVAGPPPSTPTWTPYSDPDVGATFCVTGSAGHLGEALARTLRERANAWSVSTSSTRP